MNASFSASTASWYVRKSFGQRYSFLTVMWTEQVQGNLTVISTPPGVGANESENFYPASATAVGVNNTI